MRRVRIADSNVPKNVDWVVGVEEAALRHDIRDDADARRAQNRILRTEEKRLEFRFFLLLQVKHENNGARGERGTRRATRPNAWRKWRRRTHDSDSQWQ